VIKFGRNQNLASPTTFILLRLCPRVDYIFHGEADYIFMAIIIFFFKASTNTSKLMHDEIMYRLLYCYYRTKTFFKH